MRPSRSLAFSLAILAAAPWAHAAHDDPGRVGPSALWVSPQASCARMEIVSDGRTLAPIDFRGQRWVEGRPGAEYSLVARNDCQQRVLAVLSIDGLNVLDGKSATTAQGGYVIEPGGSARVSGWRKSQQDVAAFYFSSPSASYAGRTGRPLDVGVIGAAFFSEKLPTQHPMQPSNEAPSAMDSMNKAAPGASSAEYGASRSMAAPAPRSEPSLGTGHGRRIDSSARMVEFERESYAMRVQAVRYESRERLEEMGAIPRPLPIPRPVRPTPNPFPGQPSFTPDPPMR